MKKYFCKPTLLSAGQLRLDVVLRPVCATHGLSILPGIDMTPTNQDIQLRRDVAETKAPGRLPCEESSSALQKEAQQLRANSFTR
jgi:hypothetical protein